jgi:hypothetical protein
MMAPVGRYGIRKTNITIYPKSFELHQGGLKDDGYKKARSEAGFYSGIND